MAKHNKFKKTLFFLEGTAATEAEIEASLEFEPGVQFRNASRFSEDASLETFDRLAGAVPARYQAVLDAREGKAPVEAETGSTEPPAGGATVKPVKPPVPNAAAGWNRNS